MITLLVLLLTVFSSVSALPAPKLDERAAYAPFGGLSAVSNAASLPWFKHYQATGVNAAAVNAGGAGYQCFRGESANLPYISTWKTFDTMWAINLPTLQQHNSASLNGLLREKITQIASETKVDARIILGIIMQESAGQINVPCSSMTSSGANCGIMQASYGSVSFNSAEPGNSIGEMIRNGVLGTHGSWPTGGPGFAWLFNGAGGSNFYGIGGGGHPYRALRAYNSGIVPNQGNLDNTGGFGVAWYVNDIANRLLGWNGKFRGCGY